MIEFLNGTVVEAQPTHAVIECCGVGYAVNITLSLYDNLQIGHNTRLFVRAIYREQEQVLFGFGDRAERELFDRLIKVSGIGPRIAIGIVSGMSSSELANRINSGDIAALTKLPGIGRKTAERMVLELAGKLALDFNGTNESMKQEESQNIIIEETISALLSLGFSKIVAEKATKAALKTFDSSPSVEELIKSSLRSAMG